MAASSRNETDPLIGGANADDDILDDALLDDHDEEGENIAPSGTVSGNASIPNTQSDLTLVVDQETVTVVKVDSSSSSEGEDDESGTEQSDSDDEEQVIDDNGEISTATGNFANASIINMEENAIAEDQETVNYSDEENHEELLNVSIDISWKDFEQAERARIREELRLKMLRESGTTMEAKHEESAAEKTYDVSEQEQVEKSERKDIKSNVKEVIGGIVSQIEIQESSAESVKEKESTEEKLSTAEIPSTQEDGRSIGEPGSTAEIPSTQQDGTSIAEQGSTAEITSTREDGTSIGDQVKESFTSPKTQEIKEPANAPDSSDIEVKTTGEEPDKLSQIEVESTEAEFSSTETKPSDVKVQLSEAELSSISIPVPHVPHVQSSAQIVTQVEVYKVPEVETKPKPNKEVLWIQKKEELENQIKRIKEDESKKSQQFKRELQKIKKEEEKEKLRAEKEDEDRARKLREFEVHQQRIYELEEKERKIEKLRREEEKKRKMLEEENERLRKYKQMKEDKERRKRKQKDIEKKKLELLHRIHREEEERVEALRLKTQELEKLEKERKESELRKSQNVPPGNSSDTTPAKRRKTSKGDHREGRGHDVEIDVPMFVLSSGSEDEQEKKGNKERKETIIKVKKFVKDVETITISDAVPQISQSQGNPAISHNLPEISQSQPNPSTTSDIRNVWPDHVLTINRRRLTTRRHKSKETQTDATAGMIDRGCSAAVPVQNKCAQTDRCKTKIHKEAGQQTDSPCEVCQHKVPTTMKICFGEKTLELPMYSWLAMILAVVNDVDKVRQEKLAQSLQQSEHKYSTPQPEGSTSRQTTPTGTVANNVSTDAQESGQQSMNIAASGDVKDQPIPNAMAQNTYVNRQQQIGNVPMQHVHLQPHPAHSGPSVQGSFIPITQHCIPPPYQAASDSSIAGPAYSNPNNLGNVSRSLQFQHIGHVQQMSVPSNQARFHTSGGAIQVNNPDTIPISALMDPKNREISAEFIANQQATLEFYNSQKIIQFAENEPQLVERNVGSEISETNQKVSKVTEEKKHMLKSSANKHRVETVQRAQTTTPNNEMDHIDQSEELDLALTRVSMNDDAEEVITQEEENKLLKGDDDTDIEDNEFPTVESVVPTGQVAFNAAADSGGKYDATDEGSEANISASDRNMVLHLDSTPSTQDNTPVSTPLHTSTPQQRTSNIVHDGQQQTIGLPLSKDNGEQVVKIPVTSDGNIQCQPGVKSVFSGTGRSTFAAGNPVISDRKRKIAATSVPTDSSAKKTRIKSELVRNIKSSPSLNTRARSSQSTTSASVAAVAAGSVGQKSVDSKATATVCSSQSVGGGAALQSSDRRSEAPYIFFQNNKDSLAELKTLIQTVKKSVKPAVIKTMLHDYGYVPVNTKKDNNSLLHAIARQQPGYSGGKELRLAVINHIADHRTKYETIITRQNGMEFHNYCTVMKDVSVHNDEVITLACADFLERNITIVTTETTWEFDPEEDTDIVVFMMSINHVHSATPTWKVPYNEIESTAFNSVSVTYKCSKCAKKFISPSLLKVHRRTHDKIKYTCNQCGKLYASKFNLDQHINVVHLGKEFMCTYQDCGKTFQTSRGVNDHLKYHQNKYNFMCHICDRGFMKRDHFDDHILRHEKKKPFTCEKCGTSFFRKNEVKRHLKFSCKSSNIPHVRCPICGKQLKNPDTLRNHRKSVHAEGPVYTCPYCPQVMSTHPCTIKRHNEKYHKDKL